MISIIYRDTDQLARAVKSIRFLLLPSLASNASAGSQPRVSLVCAIVVDSLIVDPEDLLGILGVDIQPNSINKKT